MGLEGKLFVREGLLKDQKAIEYVMQKVLPDIDKNSEFELQNKNLIEGMQNNPQDFINELIKKGYDAMLGYTDNEIIGHMAYQEHEDAGEKNWQMFRMKILPDNQNKGYSLPLTAAFIKKAREYNIKQVRLGKGGHDSMSKLLRILKKMELELNIKVNENSHWVSTKIYDHV